MRFTVSSSALSSKLNMLAKVIGSKNSLPILDCFLFQVANGEMSITASDSDNVIRVHFALTDHDGEGEFCVPNRVILDALKELPSSLFTSMWILPEKPLPSRLFTRTVFTTSQVRAQRNILAHRA